MANSLMDLINNPDMLGQITNGLGVRMPPNPAQTMQGLSGMSAMMSPQQGYNKAQIYAGLSESKRQFLSKYAGGSSRPMLNPAIKPKDLLRF